VVGHRSPRPRRGRDPVTENCWGVSVNPESPCYSAKGYPGCTKGTDFESCNKYCQCGWEYNKQQCDGKQTCLVLAEREKSACEANCVADFPSMKSTTVALTLVAIAMTVHAQQAAPAASPRPFPLGQRTTEIRRHLSAVRTNGTPFYVITSVQSLSDELAEKVILVRDWREQTWRIAYVDDFARQVVAYEVTHLPTGEFVRASFKIPLKAKTRMEAIAEAHEQKGDPQSSLMKLDPPTTIETRVMSRTATESEWKNFELSVDLRSDIRTSLSTLFLDGIERMREVLIRHTELGLESLDVILLQRLAHSPSCDPSLRYSKVVELAPDCDFDEDLGEPCSVAQQKRIADAAKKGEQLSHY